MDFILQNDIYYKIINEIRTPTGRISEVQNVKYFYVLHRINTVRLFEPTAYELGVPMNYATLERVLMLKSTAVKEVLHWFIENKILYISKNYSNGNSSSLYKLCPEIEKLSIDSLSLSLSECRLVEKIERFVDSGNLNCDITAHQFRIMDKHLVVNDKGIDYLKNRYKDIEEWDEINYSKVNHEDYVLLNIYLGKIYCRRNENTRRIYSSLTNMPSQQRRFLSFKGQSLQQIDLNNAQVLLSVPKIIQAYHTLKSGMPIPEDILKYKKLAESGDFYEYLSAELQVDISNERQRKKFKERFFKQIFYCRIQKRKSKFYQMFEAEFPNVLAMINIFKHSDYRTFAVTLQKFEAKIFIDNVLQELYCLGIPALSIHDSIILSNIDDLVIAAELLDTSLKKYELSGKFKTNGFNDLRQAA